MCRTQKIYIPLLLAFISHTLSFAFYSGLKVYFVVFQQRSLSCTRSAIAYTFMVRITILDVCV